MKKRKNENITEVDDVIIDENISVEEKENEVIQKQEIEKVGKDKKEETTVKDETKQKRLMYHPLSEIY